MKIFAIFSVALILVSHLLVGCGGDEGEESLIGPDEQDGGITGEYMGLASMKPGMWAEHLLSGGNRIRYEYLGTDTYNGAECYVMEFEITSFGTTTLSQFWVDKATGETVLYVMELNGEVVKMDILNSPDVPGEELPWETPDYQQIGQKDYTTPTGKAVEATVYQLKTDTGTEEVWMSGQVPFGVVKAITNGEEIMTLYDFGDDAKRDISREEAINAKPLGLPGGGIPGIPG